MVGSGYQFRKTFSCSSLPSRLNKLERFKFFQPCPIFAGKVDAEPCAVKICQLEMTIVMSDACTINVL